MARRPTRAGKPEAARRASTDPAANRKDESRKTGWLRLKASNIAFREWLSTLYDLVFPRLSSLSSYLAPTVTVAQWLSQITFGVYLGRFIDDYSSSSTFPDLAAIRKHWLIIPFAGVMVFLYIIKRLTGYKERRTKELQDALVWFAQDMKFLDRPEDDIRCTIWAPVGKSSGTSTARIRQLVHYEPRMSSVPEVGSPKYRRNGMPGRIFRITRFKDGFEQPIGIVGKGAFESIYNRQAGKYVERIPEGVDFRERMVENWNFTPAEAGRLTQDRRSFLALSMMDTNRAALLGVIYCDSRNRSGKQEVMLNPEAVPVVT